MKRPRSPSTEGDPSCKRRKDAIWWPELTKGLLEVTPMPLDLVLLTCQYTYVPGYELETDCPFLMALRDLVCDHLELTYPVSYQAPNSVFSLEPPEDFPQHPDIHFLLRANPPTPIKDKRAVRCAVENRLWCRSLISDFEADFFFRRQKIASNLVWLDRYLEVWPFAKRDKACPWNADNLRLLHWGLPWNWHDELHKLTACIVKLEKRQSSTAT